MFKILGGRDPPSLRCGVWQKKARTVCLCLLLCIAGEVETSEGRTYRDCESMCALIEGQRSSLFILPAQLDRGVCKLSTPAGRLEHTCSHMGGRADTHIHA